MRGTGTPTRRWTGERRAQAYDPRRDPLVLGLSLIVVAALVLLVLGFGSGGAPAANATTTTDVGETTVPATAERDDVGLLVTANRSRLLPGQAVRVRVTTRGGDPVPRANVTVRGRTTKTDADGTATVAFDAAGTYEIAAFRRTADTRYLGNTTIVRVERRVVGLRLRANRTSGTVGDGVRFQVVRADGTPVAATVSLGDRTLDTGADGTVSTTLETAGTVEATARKPETATVRYVPDATTLTVERRVVDLVVSTNRTRVVVGESVAILLVRADTGQSVAGTVVAGDRTIETGADGRVVVTTRRTGVVEFVGRAPATDAIEYRPGSTRVAVERERVTLALDVEPSPATAGERVVLRMARTDTGAPVAGTATLARTTVAFNESGVATLTAPPPGNYTLTARRENTSRTVFVPVRRSLSVRGPWFAVASFDGPANATAEENVTVSATVVNVGDESDTQSVGYRLAGHTLATETVTLAAGERRDLTFTVRVPANVSGTVSQAVASNDTARGGQVTVDGAGSASRSVSRPSASVTPRGPPARVDARRPVRP